MGTARWLGLTVLGAMLLAAASATPAAVAQYRVVVNAVRVVATRPVGVAGPTGDISEVWAEVDYSLIAPGGEQVEHPAGADLPVRVELRYTWDWVGDLAEPKRPVDKVVETWRITDSRYRVRYLEGGDYTIRVTVQATVVPR